MSDRLRSLPGGGPFRYPRTSPDLAKTPRVYVCSRRSNAVREFTRGDISGSRLLRKIEVHTTIFRVIMLFELATFKSGSPSRRRCRSCSQYFHRRMRSRSTVLDHELGEYPFEMFRDGTNFGGEDNRDLGVAFSLA